MKNKFLIYITIAAGVLLGGCEKDNYDEPTATLQGEITYNGEAIGVRSNAIELELWQHGYDLFTKIPVMVNQDGSYSAKLFNGNYKMVVRQGNTPWLDEADSIDVQVQGTTRVDVPVTPFYVLNNVNFTRNGEIISSTFNVEEVAGGRPIDRISMYVGRTTIVDDRFKEGWADIWAHEVGDLNEQKTMNIDLSNFNLSGRAYVFARVGIAIQGVPEMIFTDVVKLEL